MSAPPFSSFPPIFSSFPDLDKAPVQGSSNPESSRRHQKEKRKKKSEGLKESHRTGKHATKRDKTRNEPGFDKDRNVDKERRVSPPEVHSIESIKHVFYSDRKGDQMNLQYGALHAGDIPRYWPVDGTRFIVFY
jgi:hypothetical protein